MITDLLAQHGQLTSAQLIELTGLDRQKLRHQMDKLVASGDVAKDIVNRVATYSLVAAHQVEADHTALPDDVLVVLNGLRHNKARSIAAVAHRVHLAVPKVRELLRYAAAHGLAVRPFKSSERYRLPA